jgi:dihydroorotase
MVCDVTEIAAVGADLQGRDADRVVDAAGLLLLPGMIDDQVHFREPGLTHKADFTSESRAAVAGGITSFMEMPNSKPPTLSLEALEAKHARAAQVSRANYSFYLGASNDNIDAIRSVQVGQCCGVKVFMGASTGNMLVDNEQTLNAIFADSPLLIATHCEDTPTILANEAEYRARYGEDVPIEAHPLIRSEAACFKSSSLAVELAQRHDARLHVLHLTTARELQLFALGPASGKRITAEACVHHLYFAERDYGQRRADQVQSGNQAPGGPRGPAGGGRRGTQARRKHRHDAGQWRGRLRAWAGQRRGARTTTGVSRSALTRVGERRTRLRSVGHGQRPSYIAARMCLYCG